jgi:hypothetical protein
MFSRRINQIVVASAVLTIAVAVAIRLNVWEGLRGGLGWRWLYSPVAGDRAALVGFSTALYCVAAYLFLRHTVRWRYSLALSIIGGCCVSYAVVLTRADNAIFELFARTAAPTGTGPHWMAANIAWEAGEWRDWAAVMRRFGGHLNNLPPGSVMFYAAFGRILDVIPWIAVPLKQQMIAFQCQNSVLLGYSSGTWVSTIFGISMPFWAALTPIPLIQLARRIVPDPRGVVLLYPLIPAISAFSGSWNTLYPLLAVLAALALERAVSDAPNAWFGVLISGFISGVGVFFNFALIPLPLLLGCFALISLVLQRSKPRTYLCTAFTYLIGFSSVWGLFALAGGQSFFEILGASLSFHSSIDRPYLPWLLLHTWDWVLWNGLAVFLVMMGGLLLYRRSSTGAGKGAAPIWTLSLMASLFILVLSGTARGETGRVWTFLTPFLLLGMSEVLRDEHGFLRLHRWLWIAAAQACLLVGLVTSIPTMGTDWDLPQPPPSRTVAVSVNAVFAETSAQGQFRLVGWEAQIAEDELRIHLNWEGVTPSERLVWFGAVVVQDNDVVGSVGPLQPAGEAYPTTCWRAGQIISDTIVIPLDREVVSPLWVSLRAFSPDSQGDTPLSVVAGDGSIGEQFGIGPIEW